MASTLREHISAVTSKLSGTKVRPPSAWLTCSSNGDWLTQTLLSFFLDYFNVNLENVRLNLSRLETVLVCDEI